MKKGSKALHAGKFHENKVGKINSNYFPSLSKVLHLSAMILAENPHLCVTASTGSSVSFVVWILVFCFLLTQVGEKIFRASETSGYFMLGKAHGVVVSVEELNVGGEQAKVWLTQCSVPSCIPVMDAGS